MLTYRPRNPNHLHSLSLMETAPFSVRTLSPAARMEVERPLMSYTSSFELTLLRIRPSPTSTPFLSMSSSA
jgi:hypothetical protein